VKLRNLTIGVLLLSTALGGPAYVHAAQPAQPVKPAQPAGTSVAKPIYPAGVVPIAPYSPGMLAGNVLFISGQIPQVDGAIPANARDGMDDIKDQTLIVMDNLEKVLKEAGMTLANVVSVTVYLVDLNQYGDFNAVYGPIWTNAKVIPPARAAVQVGALPGGSANARVLVEVSAIAAR